MGEADRRVLRYDVAHKAVVSAFDFADGRVTEIDMPAKLADRRVLDDEQIAAVATAVTAIEEHYGYPWTSSGSPRGTAVPVTQRVPCGPGR